jgi:hypothetical protein
MFTERSGRPFVFLCLLIIATVWNIPTAFAAASYTEDFSDNQAQGWNTGSTTYTATGNVYQNDEQLGQTLATYTGATWDTGYSFRARLYGDFSGAANAVGIVYNYVDPDNYGWVWFNSRGDVELRRKSGGATTLVGKGTYTEFTPDVWFTVEVVREGSTTTVKVNGATLFDHVTQTGLAAGRIGFFTDHNLGKFDDVRVAPFYSEAFATAAPGWSTANAYAVTSGYYRGTEDSASTRALYDTHTWDSDYTLYMRIASEYSASGNTVSAYYNYIDSSNFYRVTFNSLGTISIDKVVAGTSTAQGTSTFHNFGQYTWINLQIARSAGATTVRVNGQPIFANVSQANLGAGKIGIGTVFNRVRLDDVSVVPKTFEAEGPAFPRIGTVRFGNPHNYDNTATQAAIAKTHVALLGYWRTWNQSHSMTMNTAVTNIKNSSTTPGYPKVFLYTNIMEFKDIPGASDAVDPQIDAQLDAMGWWLLDSTGARVKSTYNQGGQFLFDLTNITSFVPKDGTQDFAQWFADWINANWIQPNPAIDGIVTDNVFWQPRKDGDWNRDGVDDAHDDPTTAGWFRQGVRQYVGSMHKVAPGKLQLGNIADWNFNNAVIAPEYPGLFHGGFIENLVGPQAHAIENWGDWVTMMDVYRKDMAVAANPKLVMFQQRWDTRTDYQSVRYGLGACLLDDGYYTLSYQNAYGTVEWVDEFDQQLGYATTPPSEAPWQNGVYRRDFENGIVLVNPKDNGVRTVTVGNGFRHFSGTQVPSVNNGQAVTSVTLQDRDAVILLRTP